MNIEKYSKVRQQVMNLTAIIEEFDRMKGMAKTGAIPGVERGKTLKQWEEVIDEQFWSLAPAERQYIIDCRTGNQNGMLRWSANHYRQYPSDAELMCDLIRSCNRDWRLLADMFHEEVNTRMANLYSAWSEARLTGDKSALDHLLIKEDPFWWLKALWVVSRPEDQKTCKASPGTIQNLKEMKTVNCLEPPGASEPSAPKSDT